MLISVDAKAQTREQRIAQREARIASRMPQKDRKLGSSQSATRPPAASSSLNASTSAAASSSSRLTSLPAASQQSALQQSASLAALQSSHSELSALSSASSQRLQSYERARQQQQQEQRTTAALLSQRRQQQIDAELASSAAANDAIHRRLAELASNPSHSTPQQLYCDISAVWKDALALVATKDGIIRELNLVLQQSDDEYMQMLSRHEQDVTDVCSEMSTAAANFRTQCDSHLSRLAALMQEERLSLLQRFQSELDVLYERRKRMELGRLDTKIARERKEEKELEELRARDTEDYYALKVELEGSIAVFEQQLEDMRNMYNLNAEKLDYNHNILMERDNDNRVTLDSYRNRIRKMKETVSALAARAQQAEQRILSDNRLVSDDYMRLTEQYKGLQRKYGHSLQQESELYDNMRRMHEGECLQLARKLMHADRIITEQVLGLDWKIWWKTDKRAEDAAGQQRQQQLMLERGEEEKQQQAVAEEAEQSCDGESEIQALTAQEIVDGILQWDERANAGDDAAAAGSSAPAVIGSGTGSISSSLSLLGKVRYSPAQISAVLSLLCDECHFLIPKTEAGAASAASSLESPLIAGSDAILAAIGCDDCEDVDELCSLFYSSPADATINIDRNDVSAVVKEFVLHRQASGGRERGAAAAAAGTADGEAVGGSSVQSEKAARKREKERRYWEAMGRVVSTESLDCWTQLECWLVKYNSVLRDRETLLRDTADINRQNDELRQLLDGYMKAKINEELQVPPLPFLEARQQQQQQAAAAAARK